MLTVHHLGSSQSERIVWLCEELELPYQFLRYERDPVSRLAPPNYKALHPFGTAPVITDDNFVLGESGAIVEYLCRRYAAGRLILGPEHAEFAHYLYWFHFANGSLIPSFMMDVLADARTRTDNRTERALAMIESRLGTAAYFAGDEFTAADIMMCLLRYFATRDAGRYPNIKRYLQQLQQRPACRRAMAMAEPSLAGYQSDASLTD
jgi:glutathione S-transferase